MASNLLAASLAPIKLGYFTMSFDDITDRRGTKCAKWDAMEALYGVSPDDGIAMWVADMDFPAADHILAAGQDLLDHGVLGYQGDYSAYKNAICWWMENRHGWQVQPDEIFSTFGLVNAVGLTLQAFTQPGDGIVLFTPVYHAFAKVINASGRKVVECPLEQENGLYAMDFAAYDAQMTGEETMVILCSPHNPGGRVWTQAELSELAAFCQRHDLLLVSDEIHHDLVFEGNKHLPMPVATPEIKDRLVMLTAPSKTFNIAGNHLGNVIIQDPALHAKFTATMNALAISSTVFGVAMTAAAYSPEGAAWLDGLLAYLERNRQTFDAGINAIPGLKSMPLQSTYLAWVDFTDTGMPPAEINARTAKTAKIAANLGATFGSGGENFMRFNLGCPHSVVEDAIKRMQEAFGDLQ